MNKSKLEENSVLTIHELKEIIKGCRLEFVSSSFAELSEINAGADGKSDKGSCDHILTCFNKALGIVFTEVLPSRKDVKLSLGGIEGMDISEPLTSLLDGCHQYLKYKDTLFTREQKHFFGNYQPSKVTGVYSDEHIAKMLSFSEKLNQKKANHEDGNISDNKDTAD